MRSRLGWVLASILLILAAASPLLVAQQRNLGVAPAAANEQRVALVPVVIHGNDSLIHIRSNP